jgi:hypothetical protein
MTVRALRVGTSSAKRGGFAAKGDFVRSIIVRRHARGPRPRVRLDLTLLPSMADRGIKPVVVRVRKDRPENDERFDGERGR